MSKQTDKQALEDWEEFLEGIRSSTPVDSNETEEEKAARMRRLEKPGNEEEWFAYYFPKYCFAQPADFHKKSSQRFFRKKRIRQSRKWARGLAKSVRRMMEVFNLTFAKKFPTNLLMVSKTEDNAKRLLAPYKGNLEANNRLINDYGPQERIGKWKEEEFITRSKKAFRAVGMGQNPRGSRVDELRPNIIIFDDADDDEVCQNPDRLDKCWEWCQKSVLPTVDIAADYKVCWDNNIIAEDSLAVRAAAYCNDEEEIAIRMPDKAGNLVSAWIEKNSEEDIDEIEAGMTHAAFQGEYMNDPMSNGKTFPEMRWGKCPPLRSLPFVLSYADPATSNKDKPTVKSKAHNSQKANFLIGYKEGTFYVYTGFLDTMTTAKFVDTFFAINDYVGGKTLLYSYIENNSLQDPFYEQVLQPAIFQRAQELGKIFGVLPDARDKGEKWTRIEATLEVLNRNGKLILNSAEADNPHMKRLATQFKSAKATSKALDGPDAVEGGVFITKSKVAALAAGGVQSVPRKPNPKRY